MDKQYLTRREAASYVKGKGLPCATSTMAKLATIGGGPHFHKFGRNVVYTREALDAWIEARLSDPKPHTAAAQRVAALAAFEHFAVAAHPWRPGDPARRQVLEDAYDRLVKLCVEDPVGRARLRGAVEVILDQADRGGAATLAAGN